MEPVADDHGGPRGQGVVAPLALLAGLHDPRPPDHLQMGRQCGLGQPKRIAQLAHTELARPECFHNPDAVRIRKTLRDLHEILESGDTHRYLPI